MGNEGQRFAEPAIERLTSKQREVLDRLILHMSSKEIARELGISPHTVDQRVKGAREKFHAQTRAELALRYRRALETYENPIYQSSDIANLEQNTADLRRTHDKSNGSVKHLGPDSTKMMETGKGLTDYRVVPKLFEGRNFILFRVLAIVIFAAAIVVLLAGGAAITQQMSDILTEHSVL